MGSLAKQQGSLYSLTFNEVQDHLSVPLHSMYLDDLLKNVFTAEGQHLTMNIESNAEFSKKTVVEVWKYIKEKTGDDELSSNLGEMTLEDFLTKAGVASVGSTYVPYRHHYHQVHHPQQLGIRMSTDAHTTERKRGASDGDVEQKRRQKRMIKNRESAARSRARKQAYTNELENKVSRLEEENEKLKKQKELDTILHTVTMPQPKHRPRRSISAPF